MPVTANLTAEKALIFRITHRDNIPWILDHGLHCKNSDVQDPGFVPIGNIDIINSRTERPVPEPPRGTLADYVPFYFTPLSPMLFNIKTGQGVTQLPMDEIVILVSSFDKLEESGTQFLFTDRHAKLAMAAFYSTRAELAHLPWNHLQAGNFRRDAEEPDKFDKYQAEALAYQHVPFDALRGIVCYNEVVKITIEGQMQQRGLEGDVRKIKGYFFE